MLLKRADDKSRRLALLEDLQKSSALSFSQRKWLREEHSRLQKGISGERESAHYLDSYFKVGTNHVVLHDLRFVIDGDVAQIDHLVISRAAGMYLIETKNYAGSLLINGHGEFTADYDGDRFGIPSPIEQSHRHERVLARLLDTLDISPRTGKGMQFHHLVLLHPKAIIRRPPAAQFDTSMVIKADQFPSWHMNFAGRALGVVGLLKFASNIRSLDTIKEWGEKLIRQHLPADLMSLPDFMRLCDLPKLERKVSVAKPQPVISAAPLPSAEAPNPKDVPSDGILSKKLVCAQCNGKISFSEGKFCWNNSLRFGGLQYCRTHQDLF
jgi:hypothetical protein